MEEVKEKIKQYVELRGKCCFKREILNRCTSSKRFLIIEPTSEWHSWSTSISSSLYSSENMSMVDNISTIYCKAVCWEEDNSDGSGGKGRVSSREIPNSKRENDLVKI